MTFYGIMVSNLQRPEPELKVKLEQLDFDPEYQNLEDPIISKTWFST